MSNPNPPVDSGPEEKAARAAHQEALDGVYAAFGHPWPAMCTPERRVALVKALNAYYGERMRSARVGGWFSPDAWKDTAFDWQTLDDKSVERLTRLGFVHRYFAMSELDPRIVSTVAELVRGKQSAPHCDEEFRLWTTGFEGYLHGDRERARADVKQWLPWVRSCRPGERRMPTSQINSYYKERVRQQTHLMDWGSLGMIRASALWTTDEDRALDDLVRALLAEGYLSLDAIHKDARPLVASLFDGVVGAPRCPEDVAKVR